MYLQSVDDGLCVFVCLGFSAQVTGQGLDDFHQHRAELNRV